MMESDRIQLLFGTTGSGKTTKMEELIRNEPRVILFDTMGAEQFQNFGVLCEDLESIFVLTRRTPKFRIRIESDNIAIFDFVCRMCVKQPHGLERLPDTCIAVDEMSTFVNSAWMPPHLAKLVRLGRHTNASLIATTQVPTDVKRLIRSQTKKVYCFMMHEQADLDVFKGRIPNPERLMNLKVGEYYLWIPGSASLDSTSTLPQNPPETEPPPEPTTPNETSL